MRRRRRLSGSDSLQISAARSMDRVAGVAASLLVLGSETTPRRRSVTSVSQQQPALNDRPFLSRQATIGRNSQFHNLTSNDRELLGGIEYRSLKLLLKIVTCESMTSPLAMISWMLISPKLTSSASICSAPSASSAGSRRQIPSTRTICSQLDRTRTGGK